MIGNGPQPQSGSNIKIIYQGLFPNGEVFDSKIKRKLPFSFRLGLHQVVKGLDIGLEGMRVGGSREIVIPPELG